MNEKNHMCPICGFSELKESPYDKQGRPSYEVCPCCGYEFGFDGAYDQIAFTDFRRQWIKNGAQWFMPRLKPKDWDLRKQLRLLLFLILLLPILVSCAYSEESGNVASSADIEKRFNITAYTRWLTPSGVQAMPGRIDIIEAGGEAAYDFKILDKLPLTLSAAIDYINIDKTIPRSIPVALVDPGLTLEVKLPLFNIKNTYLGASINPSFSCDMHNFGAKSFLIPTRIVVIYIPNKQLTFICGPEFFTDFDNDIQIIGGIIYTPTDKITVSLTTDYPHILYKINDKLDLLAEGQWVLFNQYKVRSEGNDNVLLSYREAWVGGGFHFKPIKFVEASFSAGGVFNRQLMFHHAGEKVDIDKGFYLQGVAKIDF